MKLRENILDIFYRLSQYLPYAIIIVCLITGGYLIASAQPDLLFRAAIILVSLIIVSIILILQKKNIQNPQILTSDVSLDTKIAPSFLFRIYGILFFAAIAWLLYSQSRDLVLLILIVLLYSVTIVQIFAKPLIKGKYILLELILTSALFEFSKIFCHAYYFGTVDIMPHSQMVAALLAGGGVVPLEIGWSYTYFNLLHISIAENSLLSGLDIYAASYAATTIPILISVIFVYYISRYFTKSERISAVSAFFYLMIPGTLTYATEIMPMVLATMTFITFLYLFFQKGDKMPVITTWILGGILIGYMTLVHHMTIPLVFLVMVLIIVSCYFHNKSLTRDQKGLLILFFGIPIIYWLYTYLSMAIAVLNTRLLSQIEIGEMGSAVNISAEYLPYLLTIIVSSIMLVLILFGLYHLVSGKNRKLNILLLVPVALIFLVLFPNGIADISQLISVMLQVVRLRLVLGPIFAIIMGIGCVVIIHLLQKKISRKNIPVIIMIVVCILLVILSPVLSNAKDADIFYDSNLGGSTYFTEDDLELLSAIQAFIPYGSELYSDHRLGLYYSNNPNMQYYNLSYYGRPIGTLALFTEDLRDADMYPYVVFRHEMYDDGYLAVRYAAGDGKVIPVKPQIDYTNTLNKNLNDYLMIYENGLSSVYAECTINQGEEYL